MTTYSKSEYIQDEFAKVCTDKAPMRVKVKSVSIYQTLSAV